MNTVNLVERFQLYSSWRFALAQSVARYRDWTIEAGLTDPQTATRLTRVLERLAEDKLSIAFVAEFSRGKSELINAIFFADFGRRILPSSAGRTTMCPTELMYNEHEQPALRLLPIETRAKSAGLSEYRNLPDEWTIRPLDTSSADAMLGAIKHVSAVKRVPTAVAKSYGLFDDGDPDQRNGIDAAGNVEIPAWRHAIINFPHPLLAQGLVILDTPGLNAIGAEPELTLNLIPSAHAVLFLLGADTGVTKSDIQVWRDHIGPGEGDGRSRMVVLNKIDSQWDELKSAAEVDAEIARQAQQVATTLGLPVARVFPLSAQKGLVAKVNNDDKLLVKSRLPQLENALSQELIPAKQDIMRAFVRGEMSELVRDAQHLAATRINHVREQVTELEELYGKNENVMENMLTRVAAEKKVFEQSLAHFSATRSVMTQLTNALFKHLGMDAYQAQVTKTHAALQDAKFSASVLEAMRDFFTHNRELLEKSDKVVADITRMMDAMYQKFSDEFGLRLIKPAGYSMSRYLKEIERVEASFKKRFSTLSMITSYEKTLTRQFFAVIATRIQKAFEIANRDAEGWLKTVIHPVEAQIKERQQQLRRRVDSIKRIHLAADTLDTRVLELRETEAAMTKQILELDGLRQEMEAMLEQEKPPVELSAAAPEKTGRIATGVAAPPSKPAGAPPAAPGFDISL